MRFRDGKFSAVVPSTVSKALRVMSSSLDDFPAHAFISQWRRGVLSDCML